MNYLMPFDKKFHSDQIKHLLKDEPYETEGITLIEMIIESLDRLFTLAKKSNSEFLQLALNRYLIGTISDDPQSFINVKEHITRIATKKTAYHKHEVNEALELLTKIRGAVVGEHEDEKSKKLAYYAGIYVSAIIDKQKVHKEKLAHSQYTKLKKAEKKPPPKNQRRQ